MQENLSDQELLVQLYDCAGRVSYYNAAESPQWGVETQAREACRSEFKQLCREAFLRELKLDFSGYLL